MNEVNWIELTYEWYNHFREGRKSWGNIRLKKIEYASPVASSSWLRSGACWSVAIRAPPASYSNRGRQSSIDLFTAQPPQREHRFLFWHWIKNHFELVLFRCEVHHLHLCWDLTQYSMPQQPNRVWSSLLNLMLQCAWFGFSCPRFASGPTLELP